MTLAQPATAPPGAPPPAAHARRVAVRTGRGSLRGARIGLLVLGCLLVVGSGAVGGSTLRYGLVIGVIYAIAILGSNAITGLLGEINIAAGAFMAIGAYGTVCLTAAGLPFWLAGLVSVAGTAAVGLVLAVPTVRLEGIFTALVTFALAFAVPDLVVQFEEVTGGQAGLPVPLDATLFGIPVGGSGLDWLSLVTAAFLVLGLVSLAGLHGRVGRVLVSVGEGGAAAECFGVSTRRWQIAVWVWAAALAGIAGVFVGPTIGYLTPEAFPVMLSIMLLVGTVLGGARSVVGALVGGIFVGTVPPLVQDIVAPEATGLLFGGVLFAMLFAGGRGVGGLLDRAVAAGMGALARVGGRHVA